MGGQLSATTRHRLDVQGFDGVPPETLAEVAPWLRMAFVFCAVLAAIGTATASSALLGTLVVVAGSAAVFPVHPFDLIYNFGIRRLNRHVGATQARRALALRLRCRCSLAAGSDLGV